MLQWVVEPVRLGTLLVPGAVLALGATADPVRVPVVMWLLRAGKRVVIVDTGTHAPGTPLERLHQRELQRAPCEEPTAALAERGVRVSSVEYVVNTHLHWDHCSNNALFDAATFVLGRADAEARQRPPAGQELPFEFAIRGTHSAWLDRQDQLLLVDQDMDLVDGIRVLTLPGHTPGSLGVLVSTTTGEILIAGDLVPLGSNLDRAPPVLPGIVWSQAAASASLERALATGARILPSHDPSSFRAKDGASRSSTCRAHEHESPLGARSQPPVRPVSAYIHFDEPNGEGTSRASRPTE